MWAVRKAAGEEAKEIIKLFNLIYEIPKTNDEYVWLYQNNPSGPSQVWLAIDKKTGITVSARPIFPWRMKILDEELIVTQAGDALTHPDYRRRGIFTALVKATWSDLREQGIPLTYSFSNDGSLSVYRKVKIGPEKHTGCHEIGFLRRMVKPLQSEELLANTFGKNSLSKHLGRLLDLLIGFLTESIAWDRSRPLTISEIRQFDYRFDLLWKRVSRCFTVIGVRDSTFLNWRYIDTPRRKHTVLSVEERGEVQGFAVFEVEQSTGSVKQACLVEVFAIPDSGITRSLLTAVAKYCRERGVSRMIAWALEGSDYAKTLQRVGFIARRDRISFAVHIHTNVPYSAILLDSKNWFITLGDRDMVSVGS